ncbi:MAG: hypothetical protein QY314_00850 [Candidatus Dojkabacteria bacterium]|nr:MAG: hypothetical protein QY314_00850 [Candidatus Dojkabacteria bacterium]
MGTLFYTFRTFPTLLLSSLELQNAPFIFGNLKQDLINFQDSFTKHRPTQIIGFAKGSYSRFETITINHFGRNKRVLATDIESYVLHFPHNGFGNIKLSRRPTNTFCNWTMFQIAHIAKPLNIPVQFIHIAPKDILDLKDFLKSQYNESVEY